MWTNTKKSIKQNALAYKKLEKENKFIEVELLREIKDRAKIETNNNQFWSRELVKTFKIKSIIELPIIKEIGYSYKINKINDKLLEIIFISHENIKVKKYIIIQPLMMNSFIPNPRGKLFIMLLLFNAFCSIITFIYLLLVFGYIYGLMGFAISMLFFLIISSMFIKVKSIKK